MLNIGADIGPEFDNLCIPRWNACKYWLRMEEKMVFCKGTPPIDVMTAHAEECWKANRERQNTRQD